jgi:hypothetical protein
MNADHIGQNRLHVQRTSVDRHSDHTIGSLHDSRRILSRGHTDMDYARRDDCDHQQAICPFHSYFFLRRSATAR